MWKGGRRGGQGRDKGGERKGQLVNKCIMNTNHDIHVPNFGLWVLLFVASVNRMQSQLWGIYKCTLGFNGGRFQWYNGSTCNYHESMVVEP